MFTGIIEEIGVIASTQKGAKSTRLTVHGERIFQDLKLGDSVAVNGVCLTVSSLEGTRFRADVMNETLIRSTTGQLKAGSPVNLERAMAADGRFGGHIVSGHIDGMGRIVGVESESNAIIYTIEADDKILRYIVEKGSIAIDGISLTVIDVSQKTFTVSVIPHTRRMTILSDKKAGDQVNLENDVIGKYIERFLQAKPAEETKKSSITAEFLAHAGF